MPKSFLIAMSFIIGAFVLAGGAFATLHIYLQMTSDLRFSFQNAAQETVTSVEVVVGGVERYETAVIRPGETAELRLSPPQDTPFEINAVFASGRRLVLSDPVYAPAGIQRHDAFIIREDGIFLLDDADTGDGIAQAQ